MAQTSVLIGAATGFAMQHEMLADVIGPVGVKRFQTIHRCSVFESRHQAAGLQCPLKCHAQTYQTRPIAS